MKALKGKEALKGKGEIEVRKHGRMEARELDEREEMVAVGRETVERKGG